MLSDLHPFINTAFPVCSAGGSPAKLNALDGDCLFLPSDFTVWRMVALESSWFAGGLVPAIAESVYFSAFAISGLVKIQRRIDKDDDQLFSSAELQDLLLEKIQGSTDQP